MRSAVKAPVSGFGTFCRRMIQKGRRFQMTGTTIEKPVKKVCFYPAGSSLVFFFFAILTVFLVSGCATPPQGKRQTMVHEMGQQVMPFDLTKTQHIFEMTESGGIQQVIARDSNDSEQIPLIRQHLQHESMRFAAGDFSDPTSLHGSDMAGVKELSQGSHQIKIEYSALPNGAQITFRTDDVHLITALHRWFGAQLSDHGADATYR
jgi:hypothetical protein